MLYRARIHLLLVVLALQGSLALGAFEPDWDIYSERTVTASSPPGDSITWTIQGVSHLLNAGGSTYWDYGVFPPRQRTLVTYFGYYSNKRERYSFTAEAFPGSGPNGGWYRVNTFNVYVYSNCDDYVASGALPIWTPEQTGQLIVSGSGVYMGTVCHTLQMVYHGHNDSGQIVRELAVTLYIWDVLPSYPPDPPGDPDFEFDPDLPDDDEEPDGGWPPDPDDEPPYEDAEDEEWREAADESEGAGSCSEYGLPVYRVSKTDLSLTLQDTIFRYDSLGPDMRFTQTYRSRKACGQMFGPRWNLNYEEVIKPVYPPVAYRGVRIADCSTNELPSGAYVKRGSGFESYFYLSHTNTGGTGIYLPVDPASRDELQLHPDRWELYRFGTRRIHHYDRAASYASCPMGRLASIRDLAGNQVTFSYLSDTSASERTFWMISAVEDAAGRTTTFSYDTNTLCTRMDLPDGRYAEFGYDTNGNMVSSTDLAGNTTTYTYDDILMQVTNMETAGRSTSFTFDYDSPPKVTRVVDAAGRTNAYSVVDSSTVAYTNSAGLALENEVNSNGFPVLRRNGQGQQASMQYAANRPAKVITTAGAVIGVGYDAVGNVTSYTNRKGGVTGRSFDVLRRLVAETNALGQVTSYQYNGQDNLVSLTLPSGVRTRYAYDSYGRMTAETNALGGVTHYSYDAFGNQTQVVDPAGGVSTFAYDPYGFRITAFTNANGHAVYHEYDANGRVTKTTYADGSFRSFGYDCCIQTSVVDETGRMISSQRDAALVVTNIIGPDGRSVSISLDGGGRPLEEADQAGRTLSLTYDELGRVRAASGPDGAVSLGFDASWNIVAITNPAGVGWHFEYDEMDRLTARIDPLGQRASFGRDVMGRMVAATNARGQSVTYQYTADGELAQVITPDSGLFRFDHNGEGWITNTASSIGNFSYQHDAAGRVTRLGYPWGHLIDTTYDPVGNAVSKTYPGGLVVNFQYDVRERVTNLSWQGGGVSLTYDAASRVLRVNRSSGAQTEFGWDVMNGCSSLVHTCSSGLLYRADIQRDEVGRMTARTLTSDYVPLEPLLVSGTNRFAFNAADQLSSMDGAAAQCDPDGNITNIPGGLVRLSYDALGRLLMLDSASGTRALTYDAQGRLVRLQDAAGTTYYGYDEFGRLLLAADGSGVLKWCGIYAGPELVARWSPQGLSYYHYDVSGNTIAMTDTNGSVQAGFSYTPQGMVYQQGGAGSEPFTLSGSYGVLHLGDGFYQTGHRVYHADTGRFLQRDPIGVMGGINLYAYAYGDPVNFIDPDGLRGRMGSTPFRSTYRGPGGSRGAAADKYKWSKTQVDDFVNDVVARSRSGGTCYLVPAAENTVGLTRGGPWYSLGKIAYQLKEGQYGDAMMEGGGLALGLWKGTAGAAWNFVFTATPAGETEEEIAAARRHMQKVHERLQKQKPGRQ